MQRAVLSPAAEAGRRYVSAGGAGAAVGHQLTAMPAAHLPRPTKTSVASMTHAILRNILRLFCNDAVLRMETAIFR